MKIAYLGYDLSCLKASSAFSDPSHEIVFFVKEKKQEFQFGSVYNLDIFVDHLMIPGSEKTRTPGAQQKFFTLKKQFEKLAEAISTAKSDGKSDAGLSTEAAFSKNKFTDVDSLVFDLKLIRDIQYDLRRKKIILEIEKQGVEEFDLLLSEAHPFLNDFFIDRKIKFFKDSVSTNYIWSAVNFEIEYLKPVEPFKNSRFFFLVLDSARESLVDNWMFCYIEKNQLSVWSFQPSHQVGNTEFLNFHIDRIRKNLSEKFKFLYFKNYLNSFFSSVGAHNENIRVRFPQAQSVPNFQFSSQAQVKDYFAQNIEKKIKAIKKVLGEKYD